MKNILKVAMVFMLLSFSVSAQQTTFQDSLLDHMIGKWILQGTIAGKETTHDVTADWVLGHQYLEFHEISHKKNVNGAAMYEAIVYIGWNEPTSQYSCLWLDVTGGGGLTAQAIAHAKRSGDTIAFLFNGNDGSVFHTTFACDRNSDSWQWLMDGEEHGALHPFARVTLIKNKN